MAVAETTPSSGWSGGSSGRTTARGIASSVTVAPTIGAAPRGTRARAVAWNCGASRRTSAAPRVIRTSARIAPSGRVPHAASSTLTSTVPESAAGGPESRATTRARPTARGSSRESSRASPLTSRDSTVSPRIRIRVRTSPPRPPTARSDVSVPRAERTSPSTVRGRAPLGEGTLTVPDTCPSTSVPRSRPRATSFPGGSGFAPPAEVVSTARSHLRSRGSPRAPSKPRSPDTVPVKDSRSAAGSRRTSIPENRAFPRSAVPRTVASSRPRPPSSVTSAVARVPPSPSWTTSPRSVSRDHSPDRSLSPRTSARTRGLSTVPHTRPCPSTRPVAGTPVSASSSARSAPTSNVRSGRSASRRPRLPDRRTRLRGRPASSASTWRSRDGEIRRRACAGPISTGGVRCQSPPDARSSSVPAPRPPWTSTSRRTTSPDGEVQRTVALRTASARTITGPRIGSPAGAGSAGVRSVRVAPSTSSRSRNSPAPQSVPGDRATVARSASRR